MDDSITAPARREPPPIAAPQQYQVQFSTQAHVRLVERAKALLARSSPGVSLGELHRRGLELLVASLEEARFATTDQPRKARHPEPEQQAGLADEVALDPLHQRQRRRLHRHAPSQCLRTITS